VNAALLRFRVIAYVVGTVLLLLACVAMPLKYAFDSPEFVEAIGPVHGSLYVIYLLVTIDLSRRLGWSLARTLLVMLAGTVPLLGFPVERSVERSAVRETAASR